MPRAKESFESRMKKLRSKKALSLKQLANETGYSSQYLEKIEKGEVTPPVSVIIQIAKALSVESGAFLSAKEQKASEERRRKSYLVRTEAYAYQTLTPGAETKDLKAFLVTVDPQKEHRGVDYHHEGEEFIYVLERERGDDGWRGTKCARTGPKPALQFGHQSQIAECGPKTGQVHRRHLHALVKPRQRRPVAGGIYSVPSEVRSGSPNDLSHLCL